MNVHFGARITNVDYYRPLTITPEAAKQTISKELIDHPVTQFVANQTSDDIVVTLKGNDETQNNEVIVQINRPKSALPENLRRFTEPQRHFSFDANDLINPAMMIYLRDTLLKEVVDFSDQLKAFDTQRTAVTQNAVDAGDKGFAQVAGMDDIKMKLYQEIMVPYQHAELAKDVDAKLPNGTILVGPPGNGKTFIVEKFAEEMGLPLHTMSLKEVGSKWKDESVGMIHAKFDEFEKQAPCIVFMDEVDSLLSDRSSMDGSLSGSKRDEVNALLERLNNISEKGVIVLMATNNPQMLDGAGTRTGRVDNMWYVGLPDETARYGALQHHMGARKCEDDIDYAALARLTKDYTHSDIKAVVEKAARLALFEAINEGASSARISTANLKEAISLIPPSLTKDQVKAYELAQARGMKGGSSGIKLGFQPAEKIPDVPA